MDFNDDAPHCKQAYIYAQHVINGHRPACRWERLACERFINDLERFESGEFPYKFDLVAAERPCKFIELLPHTKGRWAAQRQRFILEPWQCFIVVNLFGWLRADLTRRFRYAFLLIGRKNGKSNLAAAIGLYMFCVDPDITGDFGAEVVSGATTEQQAMFTFMPMRLMAMQTPALLERYGVQVAAKNLHIPEKNSRADPIVGDPGDGGSTTCAIVDEWHEHVDNKLADTLVTGMGARLSPLALFISTAGDRYDGPCYEAQKTEYEQILAGNIDDDERFAVIYTIDDGDDWTTDEALQKANPNMDVAVSGDWLRAQQAQAVRNASFQNPFKRKHLNVWTGAAVSWLNMEQWTACGNVELDETDFYGDPCFYGIDLSSNIDLTAFARVYVRTQGDKQHYYAFADFYMPEDTLQQPSNQNYQGWHAAGYLTATDGAEIDINFIQDEVLAMMAKAPAREIVYDNWHAKQLAQSLESEGALCVEFRPTRANMSEPMKTTEGAIAGARFHHSANPILTWCAGNVVANRDNQGNPYPVRGLTADSNKGKKIDGMVAVLMAMGRALAAGEPQELDILFG